MKKSNLYKRLSHDDWDGLKGKYDKRVVAKKLRRVLKKSSEQSVDIMWRYGNADM